MSSPAHTTASTNDKPVIKAKESAEPHRPSDELLTKSPTLDFLSCDYTTLSVQPAAQKAVCVSLPQSQNATYYVTNVPYIREHSRVGFRQSTQLANLEEPQLDVYQQCPPVHNFSYGFPVAPIGNVVPSQTTIEYSIPSAQNDVFQIATVQPEKPHVPQTTVPLRLIDHTSVTSNDAASYEEQRKLSTDSSGKAHRRQSSQSSSIISQPGAKTAERRTTETFDSRFRVNGRPQRFFKPGRVFMVLWSEPTSAPSEEGSNYSDIVYGEKVFSEIRRFVVIRDGVGSCICCPIQTYGKRATTKPGARSQDHAAVFAVGEQPQLLQGEDLLHRDPFPIAVEDVNIKIDPASRLNFAKIYTVEHNVKVRNIGRIDKTHVQRLKDYFYEVVMGNKNQGPVFLVPFARNDDLVARESIFETVDRLLMSSSNHPRAAIWGLGGCGKTQIALEYAYRRRETTSCSVFWVHADSENRFIQHYSNIARQAGLSQDLKGLDLLHAVHQWLERQKNWLLILDNADDLSLFTNPASEYPRAEHQSSTLNLLRFVPKTSTSAILWTSRDSSIVGNLVGTDQGINVGSMTHKESLQLLRTLSKYNVTKETYEYERELLSILEGLPLAIAQAATYIRKTQIPIQVFLEILGKSENALASLLDESIHQHRFGIQNSLMQTWLISMRQIAHEWPLAEKILNTIAFFDSENIPFELIQAAAAPNVTDNDVLLAISRLTEYSFLQAHQTNEAAFPSYSQSRLVQLAIRQALDAYQTRYFATQAVEIMTDLFPSGSYGTWHICRLYLPHAVKATLRPGVEHSYRASKLFVRMGFYFWQVGHLANAEQYHYKVWDLRRSLFGEEHKDTLRALANISLTHWQQGRYQLAEKYGSLVLSKQKRTLGEMDPDTMKAMGNFSLILSTQGRLGEAEKLQNKVLQLQIKKLGQEHPDTQRTMLNLAGICQQLGQLNQLALAETLQLRVLELQKKKIGDEHPDTLRTMANLGITYWKQGRYDSAQYLQARVHELRMRILGEKHPDTIRAMGNLSLVLGSQGRLEEAEDLQTKVLELQKHILGEIHPDIDRTVKNLASTLRQLGKLEKMGTLQMQHSNAIGSRGNLPVAYQEQSCYIEAE
ncbi:hypothetical protein B7463_g6191, partial [Scytalidium lignicola]